MKVGKKRSLHSSVLNFKCMAAYCAGSWSRKKKEDSFCESQKKEEESVDLGIKEKTK